MIYSEDFKAKAHQLIGCLRHRAERKKKQRGVRESTGGSRLEKKKYIYENERELRRESRKGKNEEKERQ